MNRSQLEHVLRAASTIAEERDVLVIGSQSILASVDDRELPAEAVASIEADVAFFDDPGDEKADRVDGSIGELSQFHETFGYYAQGVSVSTAVLPAGWPERVVVLDNANTAPGRGLCLEPHDCVVSKLVAGRDKDLHFAEALVRAGLIEPAVVRDRITQLDGVDLAIVERMNATVQAWLSRDPSRDARE